MANVTAEQDECIGCGAGQATQMAYSMTWAVQKVERSVSKIIVGWKLANFEIETKVDLAQLAAAVCHQRALMCFVLKELTHNHFPVLVKLD